MSLKCFFNKKIINKKIKPILLRINDVYYTHQFLIGELLLQFKNQTYKIMWTLNLDNFKSCHLIITCSLNEHSHKRTFFMQLILLAHQVKNHKLDICYKINPPHNQQLFIDVFVQVQECFESFYPIYFFFLFQHMLCRNPSLRFATKARVCKGVGQEGNSKVTSHALGNVRKCEGMNPHTPKWAPTLGIGVRWTREFSESDCRGQNPLDWKIPHVIRNILKPRCLRWARMTHLDT